MIAELGIEDATLVGWSMGRTVALKYLENGGAGIGRLALVNGPIRLVRSADHSFSWTLSEETLERHFSEIEHEWPMRELLALTRQTPLDVSTKVVREHAKLDFPRLGAGESSSEQLFPSTLQSRLREIPPAILRRMRTSWIESWRRLWTAIGSLLALPATGTADEGTWYELRPGGVPSVGVTNPQRYGDQAQAEEAAGRLLTRHPGFRFVEIITYEIRDGRRSPATLVGRV